MWNHPLSDFKCRSILLLSIPMVTLNTEKNTIKMFPAYLQLKEKGKADNKQVNTLTFAKYPPKGQRYIKALPFSSNALKVI